MTVLIAGVRISYGEMSGMGFDPLFIEDYIAGQGKFATFKVAGLVGLAEKVEVLPPTADLTDVISKINELITSQTTSRQMSDV